MKTLNTTKLKMVNQNSVYSYIYNNRHVNKAMICENLDMCLSTVNSNLKSLESLGVIKKNGYFESTGGRKSDQIEIVNGYKITIGIAILKNKLYFVATNLYCDVLYKSIISLSYIDNHSYYTTLSKLLNDFINDNSIDNSKIIGVSIATQGIVIDDRVAYGRVIGNTNMSLDKLRTYIDYDIYLEHDSKCAAYLELWNNNITTGYVILLNYNLGSAVIVDGKIISGLSGTIEHYHFDREEQCYCGKRGCLETICSLSSLQSKIDCGIDEFFVKLRNNDSHFNKIWIDYLDSLSIVINNVSYVIEGEFILSGELSTYFIKSDLDYIYDKVSSISAFDIDKKFIKTSNFGEYAQAIGSTLHYINNFITSI